MNGSKALYSRDVVFDDSKPGVEKEPKDEPRKPAEQDMYLDTDSDAESVVGQAEPMDGQAEEMVDQGGPVRGQPVRDGQPPDMYGELVNLSQDNPEPSSVGEAMASSDKSKWRKAMKKEMESLYENEVWDLVDPPKGRKIVGSKWVFKEKMGADGTTERYKAWLVAQGFSQKRGLDYDETFSPVLRTESVRSMKALAGKDNLLLHQMDVTTAFLNETLEEEVYMKQPEGFATMGKEHLVCKLTKSIYGLKQLPRCWNMYTAPNTMICGAVYTKRVRKNNTSKILTSIPLYPCTFINSMLFSNTKERLSYSCPPQHDSDLPGCYITPLYWGS